jgi:hypothetical protein
MFRKTPDILHVIGTRCQILQKVQTVISTRGAAQLLERIDFALKNNSALSLACFDFIEG